MLPIPEAFTFDYFGSDIVYGRGRVAELDAFLAARGLERALVVTGTNVSANDDVMRPVRGGLGDRLTGVFGETTPTKHAETVYDGIEAMAAVDADVLVGLGGGSSLDIARQVSVFADDGRSLETLREEFRAGELTAPEASADPTPVVVVPTTFAGADIATGGKVAIFTDDDSPTGETVRTGGDVSPVGMVYDPNLFETTPERPLLGSAMNGFDKPIETLYARHGDPIIQSTAMHSLRLFRESLPRMTQDPAAMDRAVVGIILALFRNRISVIHAFGQAISRRYPVHQGEVHAAVAPHVLRYLLENADANAKLLAAGFGINPGSRPAGELRESILSQVTAVRDGLGLPTRLGEFEVIPRDDIPAIAGHILENANLQEAPKSMDPTAGEIERVLTNAW